MGLSIHLLGTPRVLRDGVVLPPLRGHKAWGLLAYLAHREAGMSRSHLASLLFVDAEDPLAALRWNLSELRRVLGDAGLRGETIALDRALPIDVWTVQHGTWAEALSVPALEHELLEGMNFASSPSFDIWLTTERRHLRAAAEAALHEAALARLGAHAPCEAADLAARLVRLNPLDENYQALLVRSLAASGDGIGAARQAAACTELFRRELGVTPGRALADAMHTETAAPTTGPVTGRSAAMALIEAGQAAIGAGVLDAGLQCLRRAIVESDAARDGELRTRTRVALGAALVHAARGRDEEGSAALHEALAIAQQTVPHLAAAACRELGYVEFLRGRYARALAWLRKATPLADGDHAEQARIATVQGSILSDTARYAEAIAALERAEQLANAAGDARQLCYVLAMRGRASLLSGNLASATEVLDRSVALASQRWTAFLPWPQSLRAEIDLQQGDVDRAAQDLEQAFALGCQLGDPCWEGIAGRGLGKVAAARGDPQRALLILRDSVQRCMRLPDAYLWGKGYVLDALCGLAVSQGLQQASAWIDELHALSARAGMREFTVRSHLHWARLGNASSLLAARVLAQQIDNPQLHAELAAP